MITDILKGIKINLYKLFQEQEIVSIELRNKLPATTTQQYAIFLQAPSIADTT